MKLDNKLKTVYKSKPDILALVLLIVSVIIFPLNIITNSLKLNFITLCFIYILFSLLIYILFHIGFYNFGFNKDFFFKHSQFRLFYSWRVKKYNYSDLYVVEIIKLSYPYMPAVVFHFSKKTLKKTFFRNRSYAFGYRKVKELTPLIELLVEKKVNFIIKTSRGKDRIFFKRIIEATKERTSSSTKVEYVKYEM